jgi:hypothetical protein
VVAQAQNTQVAMSKRRMVAEYTNPPDERSIQLNHRLSV